MKLTSFKFKLIALLFSLILQNANALDKSMFEYYGNDHNEAEFSIIGYVIIEQTKEPTTAQIDRQIRKQMRYMLGLMRSREKQASALYPKWTFETLEIKKNNGAGSYTVKYDLKTKGLFASRTKQYTFSIPYNPNKIYAQSQGVCRDEKTAESSYWYHWEPLQEKCPLAEGKHYFNYTTQLTPIENTTETYPEYKNLIDADKTIKMTMIYGFTEHDVKDWTPQGSKDSGRQSYNQQRVFLQSLGFTENIWTRKQVETLYKAKDSFIPYIIEYTREGTDAAAMANMRIRIILADTELYHRSVAFHTLLKDALKNESVVVYNGHSGIGKNLDLALIEKMRGFKFSFNPEYQILFLGSCIPYSYYTDMFFNRKKSKTDIFGTLKLDTLSYGKESLFGSTEDRALTRALVNYAQNGEKKSYQEIINSSPNYYFGVNGDEDNPISK